MPLPFVAETISGSPSRPLKKAINGARVSRKKPSPTNRDLALK
jgi:hypothetical protein